MNQARALLLAVALLGGCTRPQPVAIPADAEAPGKSSGLTRAALLEQGRAAGGRVRPSVLAGSWYPAERAVVMAEIERLRRWSANAPGLPGKPLVLVVPHAGWSYSGEAAMAAFRNLQRGDFARVVLVGPSHHAYFEGFSISEVDAYRTPLGDVPLCREARELKDGELVRPVPGADDEEHSLEIELPLLQSRLGPFCLVPILVGETTLALEQALARKLARLHDGRTLFVFSSDFIHYGPRFGYVPFGPSARQAHGQIVALEQQLLALLERKDAPGFRQRLDSTGATVCGRRGLSVMLELLGQIAPSAQAWLLAHYASTELPGERGDDGVWYVALAYLEQPSNRPRPAPLGVPPRPGPGASSTLSPQLAALLPRLARAALRTELRGTSDLEQELVALPQSSELDRLQAVFVTLTEDGQLRGCVGQVEPEYWLPEAVVRAAVDAARNDSRFRPVSPAELDRLSLEVTVLSPPHPVASWQKIELGRHGIVLEKEGRRALFLPQVPQEQGWNLTQTLEALARKAGLPDSAWRDPDARFMVFTGQVLPEQERPGRGTPAPGQPEAGARDSSSRKGKP